MGKTIIITEKPSVAQEYKKVLGIKPSDKTDGYIEGYSPVLQKDVQITWAVGHLISLGDVDEQREGKALPANHEKSRWDKGKLPIIPEDWVYKVGASTKKQFAVVKKLYTQKDIDCIYYAGDSGREGIYIQALIRNQIFTSKPKFEERVVWIDSYTDESILSGIKNAKPYSAYQNMVDSGYERAKRDWLIGMNFTQALTLTSGAVITVGRVMTPTLRMVVDRQSEIDNFVPTDYFGINAVINDSVVPRWKAVKGSQFHGSDLLYSETGFKSKDDAMKLISLLNKSMELVVEEVKETEKKEYAPLLFNLADLQAWCSKRYHISPDKTLEIAQMLYEKKLTTYPRTDARVLSSAVAKDIAGRRGEHVPSKYVNDDKITDHYAIIPTYDTSTKQSCSLSGIVASVYEDIKNRYEAIFMAPYIYDSVEVTYIHDNGERFFLSGKNVKQLGYRKLYGEAPEAFNTPCEGEIFEVRTFDLNAMTTQAPSPYTTGTLILAMEKAGKLIEDEELREQIKTCGIGTSATRAGIIEKLSTKGYITIDKKQKVAPTSLGKTIIPVIAKYDSRLVSPEKTAELEQQLSDIAEGKIVATNSSKTFIGYIRESVESILSNGTRIEKPDTNEKHDCPKCGKTLKYGKFGWFCDCGFNFYLNVCGHTMTVNDLKSILSTGHTRAYKMTSKAGKTFYARLTYNKDTNKCDMEFQNDIKKEAQSQSEKKTTRKKSPTVTKW